MLFFPRALAAAERERRLTSWQAAAKYSGSQSGRRSGAGFAAGSRSSCQTEAADLREVAWAPSPPRRSVLALLTYWRRERAQGILEALTPQKRGPKSKRNPMEEEVQKLRRQNARLTEDLRKAHIIIDVPKKVAALLGHPIRSRTRGEILMAAVAELASDVGTSAACQALCMPRASYYRDGRKTSAPAVSAPRPSPARALRPAEQDAVLACLHEERLQPLFMRRCSMKASITARFAPCIACSTSTARFASAAIS